MTFALEQYADDHGGRYPAGESSPEASLSLLYREKQIDAYTLRGMIVPEKTTRDILEQGKLLGPESCGWHYTEGLTKADDEHLALLWVKAPLGHNGERTRDGGRQVVFVQGNIQWISGNKWDSFLAEQKSLLAQRSDRAEAGLPLVEAFIELPDGSRVETFEGPYTITHSSQGPDSSGHGTESGGGMSRSTLLWYSAPIENGAETRTLSFSNLVSAPVTVVFSNGIPDQTNVVFKMRRDH